MIWNKKIIDLFLYYGFSFQRFPPSEDELVALSFIELKRYRDLRNILETAYESSINKHYIIKALQRGKLSVEEIAEDFCTTTSFVLKVKRDNNL